MPFTKLPPLLAEALAARDYVTPTPVQAAVLETEAEGRDLIVSAQTGSGKTVAFGLAMAPLLLDEEGRASQTRTPLDLAIAPTRELALQVSRELMWLYGKAGARIATCFGGMSALGQNGHWAWRQLMFAFHPKADVRLTILFSFSYQWDQTFPKSPIPLEMPFSAHRLIPSSVTLGI